MPQELDQQTLKALSADTRKALLQELGDHGKTPTYLAEQVGKHPSTVVEHLDTLREAGLVAKDEQEGRKRVTYTLTKKGKRLTSSRGSTVVLAASAVTAVTGGAAALWSLIGGSMTRFYGTTQADTATIGPESLESGGGDAGIQAAETTSEGVMQHLPAVDPVLAAGLVLLLIGVTGGAYWYRSMRGEL